MILRFPRQPIRATHVTSIGGGLWMAAYAGDEWQDSWQTEAGEFRLVMDVVQQHSKKCGLPYIVHPPRDEQWRAA